MYPCRKGKQRPPTFGRSAVFVREGMVGAKRPGELEGNTPRWIKGSAGHEHRVERPQKEKRPHPKAFCFEMPALPVLVPFTEVFSNQMLEDLEKIWALRFIIPDPTNPFLSTISCATERKE